MLCFHPTDVDKKCPVPVTEQVAGQILQRIYGLELNLSSNLKELDSYEDKIYFISADNIKSVESDHVTQSNLLLKISNRSNSSNIENLDVQNQIVTHLQKRGFMVPPLILTIEGKSMALIKLLLDSESEWIHAVRLFLYLPGEPIGGLSLTPNFCFLTSAYFAQIDKELMNIEMKHSDRSLSSSAHISPYNLTTFDSLTDYIALLEDCELKRTCLLIVDRFRSEIKPILGDLSTGYIHGDGNCENILVDPDSGSLSGIIDWADSHQSCHVFELAILLTHILADQLDLKSTNNSRNLKQIGKAAIDGYQSMMNLSLDELKLIPLLIGCRLACIYVMSRYELLTDSHNRKLNGLVDSTANMLETLWTRQYFEEIIEYWF